ncbi:diguanylate cyclase (GGDEF) domain-containing protein [Paenibacillus uliginis N3/975]|uniref:histidine kinase n=1 Tax=Paenibacillus uliginis N3/975 TaxID=1313296 RepID=A0A1X7HBE7_9BACL|nr:ATP-binding protein [Paenibacillus uliginis]SMF83009.1 diguanylate cyclase (GGDEF) domain-containing protein [Paenibacillus uliginis N3/975]
MSINIIKLLFVPFISLFIIVSSISLGKDASLGLMIFTGLSLSISLALDRKYPRLKVFQFIFLGAFHFVSNLNWCILLYYIVIINLIQDKEKFKETMPVAFLLVMQYSIIRLTYTPLDEYNLLVSIFDIISSFVIIMTLHIMIRIESEKITLTKQNDYLINHDSLTGFLNYEGYMKTVQELTDNRTNFQLVLLDINNFKSLNAKDIATANEILIHFSRSIQNHFTNMLGSARYAGDRFAILLPSTDRVKDLMPFDELGIQITYSVTKFPQEASTFQEIISMAEERIFQMRRESWLKTQEEFMRSAKMKTVGELAAGMAHEIRNPLTAIKGFVQLSKIQNYNIEPWYEVIMGEITRVGELTAEFLQFSKPHASNMKPDSLRFCMTRVFSLCESEAASRGHSFTMDILDDRAMVYMDRDKIIQVMINLIRNAFQAMETTGHVHFSLHIEGKTAIIEVSDTGKGIAEADIVQIFDPFYTTKEEGTGLGLSLCQKIVEDHGGSISVQSELEKGTVFTIRLPISEDPVSTI